MALEVQINEFRNSVSAGFGNASLVNETYRTAQFVSSLIVQDEDAHEAILGIWEKTKRFEEKLEEKRKEALEPYDDILDYVAAVKEEVKQIKEAFKAVEKQIKAKSLGYHELVEANIEKQKQKAQEMEDMMVPFDSPFITEKPNTLRSPTVISYVVRKKKAKIVDLNQVPREFLMLDEEKIELAIKKGVENIPGIEVKEEKDVIIKRKGKV